MVINYVNRIILTVIFAIPFLALSQKDFHWRASVCYEDFSDSTHYEVNNKFEVDTFKFSDGNREYSILRTFNVMKGQGLNANFLNLLTFKIHCTILIILQLFY